MMARKPDGATPRYVLLVGFGVLLLATSAQADGDPSATAAPSATAVSDSASAANASVAEGALSPAQLSEPVRYQTPFAEWSKAPPIDPTVRQSSVNRWQRPVIPHTKWAAPYSAETPPLLSGAEPGPNQPTRIEAESGPPATALSRPDSAPPRASLAVPLVELAGPEKIIRSTPRPLAQPDLVASHGKVPIHTPGAVPAAIAGSTSTRAKEMASLVANCEDTPESWLAQAQDAATTAKSAGELSTVLKLCDRGLHCSPSAKMLFSLRRLSAWAHNRRGEMLADAQQPDQALDDFQAAIGMDSNCSLAIHNRGVTLAQRNQFAAALRDFNRVIELNPGLAIAYRNRAELLAALGRTREALADYDQAIASLAGDATLFQARAHARQRLRDFEGAADDLERALRLVPQDAGVLTQRGDLAAEQGKFAEAEKDFHQAIAVDSNHADAYRSLAWLQATCPDNRRRNAAEALSAAQRAAQLATPGDYRVLDTLAAAQACGGHFDRAIELQQKALAGVPPELRDPLEERLALYQRGQTYSGSTSHRDVRTVSHESASKTTPRPSPTRPTAPAISQ